MASHHCRGQQRQQPPPPPQEWETWTLAREDMDALAAELERQVPAHDSSADGSSRDGWRGVEDASFTSVPVSQDMADTLVRMCQSGDANQLMIMVSRTDMNRLVLPDSYHRATLLHIAAAHGRQDIVHSLIPLGARVDVRDASGRTPLHCAAANRHARVVQDLLLPAPHTIDARDRDGNTALHLAARSNDRDLCLRLMHAKADPSIRNCEGKTPQDLAEDDAVASVMGTEHDGPAMVEAIMTGSFCTLQSHLTRSNVNFTLPAKKNASLLHLAATVHNRAIVELLLKSGAAVDGRDDQRMTPLHWAAAACDLDAAHLLLINGAAVNALDATLTTPLLKAVKCCCYYTLMYKNAVEGITPSSPLSTTTRHTSSSSSPSPRSEHPTTRARAATYPCRLPNSAASASHDAAAHTALAPGFLHTTTSPGAATSSAHGHAQQQQQQQQRMSPPSPRVLELQHKYRQTVTFVKLLLRAGADPNAMDAKGNTPLHYTAIHSLHDVAALLLCHPHTDVDARNLNGDSALHLACQHDADAVVELLLPKVADVLLTCTFFGDNDNDEDRDSGTGDSTAGSTVSDDGERPADAGANTDKTVAQSETGTTNAATDVPEYTPLKLHRRSAANNSGLTPLDLCAPGSSSQTLLLAARVLGI